MIKRGRQWSFFRYRSWMHPFDSAAYALALNELTPVYRREERSHL
jgi:hypothetical protein